MEDAMKTAITLNAGLRLGEIQKQQKTGLCVGLDPHYDPQGVLNAEFYMQFADHDHGWERFEDLLHIAVPLRKTNLTRKEIELTAKFLSGINSYFVHLVDIYWEAGLRVFKPQAAFYERLPFGMLIIERICNRLHGKGEKAFLILDAKRGDIDSTQAPYYEAYLSDTHGEVPLVGGLYNFDTMTVTTWMGEDVLTPGIPYFKNGKGAIVVTRSSNPSGTTLQDAYLVRNQHTALSEKQEPFRLSAGDWEYLSAVIERKPTVHEAMLYITEKFSKEHGLNQDGVSPIFSVMGSTVKMADSFRLLRPCAIPLIPGFGAQGGTFKNIMSLVIEDGPLAGHIGILSSSRDHNYAWMTKAGGSGDPKNLRSDTLAAIQRFREAEKVAYAATGMYYPFN
jgi:orotidine-5'-phosphate decarboxylase